MSWKLKAAIIASLVFMAFKKAMAKQPFQANSRQMPLPIS